MSKILLKGEVYLYNSTQINQAKSAGMKRGPTPATSNPCKGALAGDLEQLLCQLKRSKTFDCNSHD
eukprot:CAMPEP_0183467402 /NCGR_PEP_ID=MMETSP0370-20130417/150806_1 /TAXON_ID=268820 /ORGANISM="Peridinium aciculiferum, Strain PAER-2" /LENGTH=65 /DNA_ID=CAMNT_0025659741 /DNA_START=10 /DNA_END=207 /DNA_ORIENTATION=-